MRRARIVGTGSYLPCKVLTNEDLEKIVETSDEWIVSRTGMKERRIAEKDEFSSDMGYEAAKNALASAGKEPVDIDLILVASVTPDYIFPSTACLIQKRLQAVNAAAADIQATCSGYLYALCMAKAFIESGIYRNVLVVAAEKLSSIVNYKDRNTCILFGDGAAACLVSDSGRGFVLKHVQLGADGEQAQILSIPGGGSRLPATHDTVREGLHYLRMDGKEVFKHAVRRMELATKACLDTAGIQEGEISWLIPHQANVRIIEALAKRFQVPADKVFLNIHKYGNTSAPSVGIALDELTREHPLQTGENIILTAFGGGLTWGAAALTLED